MMQSHQKKEEYTELEYLESTGTQWIDVGVSLDENDSVKIEFEYGKGQFSNIFGYRDATNVNNVSCFFSASGIFTIDFNNSDYIPFRYELNNAYYNKKMLIFINKHKRGVDGIGENNKINEDRIRTGSVYLFNTNGNPYPSSKATIKIYSMEIINKIDFIPVLDPQGTPCMYDKVSKDYFYNKGTGEFLYKVKEQ